MYMHNYAYIYLLKWMIWSLQKLVLQAPNINVSFIPGSQFIFAISSSMISSIKPLGNGVVVPTVPPWRENMGDDRLQEWDVMAFNGIWLIGKYTWEIMEYSWNVHGMFIGCSWHIEWYPPASSNMTGKSPNYLGIYGKIVRLNGEFCSKPCLFTGW